MLNHFSNRNFLRQAKRTSSSDESLKIQQRFGCLRNLEYLCAQLSNQLSRYLHERQILTRIIIARGKNFKRMNRLSLCPCHIFLGLPQRLLLPTRRTAHRGWVNTRISSQQGFQVCGESVAGDNDIQQIGNTRQLRIEFVWREREIGQPTTTLHCSWHTRLDGIATIPDARVVGTEVAERYRFRV